MNRQQFNSRNNIGEVLTLQKSGSTNSFDPTINFTSGSRRVSWKLDNGSETKLIAGNNITYTGFTSDNGIRTIEMRCSSLKNINNFNLINDNLYGNVDVSNLDGLQGFFLVRQNPGLTGITHSPSTEIFTSYQAYSCNLTGNLNLPLSGLSDTFLVYNNPNLTGITHVTSSQVFNRYDVFDNNLTGNLNLPFSKLGGTIYMFGNSNLTGVTHVPSTEVITQYDVKNCNITGNLILPFSGLSGQLSLLNNPNLTGVTHSSSTNYFTLYLVNNCNLTGTHDISMLSNFGGNNSANGCNMSIYSNSGLTNVVFPTNNNFFRNRLNSEDNSAFGMYLCDLNYVDFKTFSGATLVSGATQGSPRISLRDNNMVAADVNHILVDFSGNASYNPTGWSNVNLNIGGTNANPDSSSGGYNGLAAIAFLTGSPYNWTITY